MYGRITTTIRYSYNDNSVLLKYDGCELSAIAWVCASFGEQNRNCLDHLWLTLIVFQLLTVVLTTLFVLTERYLKGQE